MMGRVRVYLLFTVLFSLLSVTSSHAQETVVGFVKTVTAEAFLLRDGNLVTLNVGDDVYQTDIIQVGESGALGITFVDNTILSFGPNTHFELVDYAFEPLQQDYSFIGRIIRGTFVYISGDIGRNSTDGVRLETPLGIIGIRGTRFAASAEGG